VTAQQDARDLRNYVIELRSMLFDKARLDGGTHQKISGSPAPWNPVVGHLLMDIHAGARQRADLLDLVLGNTRQARGSTDAGTLMALTRIAVNVGRLTERDSLARENGAAEGRRAYAEEATAELGRWAHRCRQELDQLRDDEQPWTRAPGGLTCPNPFSAQRPAAGECGRDLWLAPGWALEPSPSVYCRRCRTEDGGEYGWPYDAWSLVVAGTAA
jgi:hypothetical protein